MRASLGANGKSIAVDWLNRTLGDYYLSASRYIFFGDKEGSGATPWLAALKGKRIAVVEETDTGHSHLHAADLKRNTGIGTFPARKLYGVSSTSRPAKLFMSCLAAIWLLKLAPCCLNPKTPAV